MKRIVLSICALAMAACSQMLEVDEVNISSGKEITFTATVESRCCETKTERQEDGAVWWKPGDAVSLFFVKGEKGGSMFIAQNKTVSELAEFKGTIDSFAGSPESSGGEFWFWSVYPYSEDNSCDGESVTIKLPAVQKAVAGTFADNTFPTLARAKGLELPFYNVCGGAKLILSRDDIVSVSIKGNNGEMLSGTARVVFPEGSYPSIERLTGGATEITLKATEGTTFESGKDYYLVIPPVQFSSGFTLTFRTSGDKEGTYVFPNTYTVKRSTFVRLPNLDARVETWETVEDPVTPVPVTPDPINGEESGLYFGLSTFDRLYQYYPVRFMSEETLEAYNSIVNDMQLTELNGTLLYYSCDEDITAMQSLSLPSDLTNVSLITFTDGLDQGSINKHLDLYTTRDAYLDAVHNRLATETVSGFPIKSYAIGLMGPDAQSNITEFRKNLNKIASTPVSSSDKYVYEIDNNQFSALSAVFSSIAKELSERIKVQSIHVHFSLPDDGERIRLTLDALNPKTQTADASSLYIEGVFDLSNWSLRDITYRGFSVGAGDNVHISDYDGFEVFFDFDGLQTATGAEINEDNILQWSYTSSNSWQWNSEFTPKQGASVKVKLSSALVVLNLDLSKSLEGKLTDLKKYVKEFITTLYSSSVDPNVVKSIKLDNDDITISVGHKKTLVATVSPSTASSSTLKWTSSLPSVATVDSKGVVTGMSEGVTYITASTEDGKQTATCKVSVEYIEPGALILDETSISLYKGATYKLTATFLPEKASISPVSWSSSEPMVATISDEGLLSAVGVGVATIEASLSNGIKSSCIVMVLDSPFSSVPIDLSLSISLPSGARFFVTAEQYKTADLSAFIIEGLYVKSAQGDFIISLGNATTNTVSYSAASAFFDLPNKEQGITISSRYTDINAALMSFGGVSLSGTYWTSAIQTSSYYYVINGSGGSLGNLHYSDYARVREVVSVANLSGSPWQCMLPERGLSLAISDGVNRQFVNSLQEIPSGYYVEGLAIENKGCHFILAMKDSSSDTMTYSAASANYPGKLPNELQALLISARFSEINTSLTSFGGARLSGTYWTSAIQTSSYYYVINGSGGSLGNVHYSNYARVREVIDTF